MKISPQDAAQQDRLKTSRFSATGFMGNDQRPVGRVIAADKDALQRLNVTAQNLAQRLRAVDDRARAAFGAPVNVMPGVVARHCDAMGKIPSPFPGDGVFPKGETRIEWDDGRLLRVSRLGIMLIERHGFFQGRGSPYRIEPALAALLPDGDKDQ